MANLTADGKQDLSSLANLQNVGNAQKIIDLFGQEIFVFLQSPMWQERDQALQSILGQIDEFMSKDQSAVAFNQVISLFSFSDKNQ